MTGLTKLAVSVGVAVVICSLGAEAVNRAVHRAEAKGRYLGQCDVIVPLDRRMHEIDPTWVTPKIVPPCRAALAKPQAGEAE